MRDEDLREVVRYWSYWDTDPAPSVPRSLSLPERLDPELVLAIQGVRRSGKSTLLGQLVPRFGLDRSLCFFVNFEDPRLHPELGPKLLSRIVELFPTPSPRVFLFDEIQNVPRWESWLHTRLERPSDCFVVTGSNATLLSGNLSASLTGRHLSVKLFPFDFGEARRATPALSPERFLTEGGFPKVVLSGGDLNLRQQYFRDIVERDITNRVGARDSGPVMSVVRMVFEASASELSLRRVAAVNGLSTETAGGYLRAAEEAFLLFACPYFTFSSRKSRVRNAKYYPVDTGLRNAVISSFSPDLGKSLECAAFLALKKKFGDVFYWRGRREVDFVITLQGRPLPIQVTWDATQERHSAALDEFYENHPTAHEGLVINREDLAENFGRLDALLG